MRVYNGNGVWIDRVIESDGQVRILFPERYRPRVQPVADSPLLTALSAVSYSASESDSSEDSDPTVDGEGMLEDYPYTDWQSPFGVPAYFVPDELDAPGDDVPPVPSIPGSCV